MKTIDFSNWEPIPDAATVRCWLTNGYQKAIIGGSFPRPSDGQYIGTAQINMCSSVGMDTEAYAWLQFTDDWEPVFRHGCLTPATWIDCEDPSVLGVEGTRQRIRDAILITGAPDVYCRRLWWLQYTGDWNIIAEYPTARLWEATLNGNPIPFVPFAGFAQRFREQYAADIDVCGITVDISEEEPVPDSYTKAEIDQMFRDVETVIKLNHDELMVKLVTIESMLARLRIAFDAASAALASKP